ncbi:hypothetical protein KKG82_01995 [Patescibacteria group bacterium]|nr:hypothetical protein [Patescibacteria group bacterium]
MCPICQIDQEFGQVCISCRALSNLKQHIALCPYDMDLVLVQAIDRVKYQFEEDCIQYVEEGIKQLLEKYPEVYEKIDVVVAIPLHKKRYAERGFNQSEYIASILAKQLNISQQKLLQRTRQTKQQALCNKEDRLLNVKDAFAYISQEHVGENILLVDDVYTTGATMQEAARVLKEQGHSVWGFSVARGVLRSKKRRY